MSPRTRHLAFRLLAVMAAVLPTACGEREQPVAATPVERTAAKGPVEVTVTTDRGEITVGDTVTLEIEVSAEPGVDVVMPSLEEPPETFEIRSARRPPDVPEGDRRVWRHQYELRTFTAGAPEIGRIAVSFVDRRAGGQPIEAVLETEPITLTVRSTLDDPDLATAPPLRDPVEVPVERLRSRRWLIAIAAAIGVIGLAIVGILLLRRFASVREPTAAAPVVPAHVWALEQLRRLADDELLEREEYHAYYVRLSDIVREYVERRFGLMAPERTTEEFLREARRDRRLDEEHRSLLASFLRTADMVKFARYEPGRSEGEAAWVAAERFVEQTAASDPATEDDREVAA